MFFRKATDSTPERRTSSRQAGSSDAQLKELRNKARRRLIGALALVLAAVIVVPPLFDAPPPEPVEPIVVPAISSGIVSMSDPEPIVQPGDDAPPAAAEPSTDAMDAPTVAPTAPEATTPPQDATPPASPEPPAPEPAPAPATQSPAPAAQTRQPASPEERTDDGSVALALLAGKMPGTDTPAQPKAQGSFVLQVAAYTTEQDARQRRDSLVESGVTNAYVERGQSGDKTVYRLRVGPFPTHEAAQAAQTRLRALGYQNGLISSK